MLLATNATSGSGEERSTSYYCVQAAVELAACGFAAQWCAEW